MPQPFPQHAVMTGVAIGPAIRSFAITPNDSTDLADYIRGICIGTAAGVLVYHAWDGTVCTTGPLTTGDHALLARRILSTGTTATGLTGYV